MPVARTHSVALVGVDGHGVEIEAGHDLGEITARGDHRVIRVAWTLSDLAGILRPGAGQTSHALSLCLGAGPDSPHRELRSGADDTCSHVHPAPPAPPARRRKPASRPGRAGSVPG